MIIKKSAIAIAAVALSAMLGSTGVRAQENCPALYSQMMGIYQADPYSPTYAQMLSHYNSACLSGASYQPQPYAAPAYSPYQQPAPYAYAVPAVDPGAAILGAAVVGGTIAATSNRYRDRDWDRHDNWENRRWRR